jgi:hypothetical protein
MITPDGLLETWNGSIFQNKLGTKLFVFLTKKLKPINIFCLVLSLEPIFRGQETTFQPKKIGFLYHPVSINKFFLEKKYIYFT